MHIALISALRNGVFALNVHPFHRRHIFYKNFFVTYSCENNFMTQKPDFEALFRASPYPYLVMANDLTIIGASDAYLRAVGRTEAEIVGRYLFDAFPENPDDPDSTNVIQVKSSLMKALATGQPDTAAFIRYAVPLKTAQGVVFQERFWSTVHTPVLGADGKVAFLIQNAIDVTDLYSFNKSSQTASLDLKPHAAEHAENFNRAQMHEALARILNDERSHLRNLFNQAPGFVAVLMGPKHVFEMANEAYYQLVGHRDILGKPVWEALPEIAGQGFEELLNGVYQTGKPWTGRGVKVSVQRQANGPVSERYIDLLYQPFFAADGSVIGIFAQGHDVTDAHEAQAAQRESEDRLQEGMLAAKMVVWDWEIESRIMVFSDNAAAILGQKSDSIDLITDGIHPQDRERLQGARKRATAEKSGYQEIVRFTRPDNGKMIWIDVRGKVRCDAAGIPYAVRGVTLDITERMQAEQDLRETDRRKDEFLAMLAHELRNPLAPISAAAQLMKLVKLDDEKLKQTSDIITRQINHMTGLVDDLIDVSRVTRGLVSTDKQALDVKRIIADAVEQITPLIESKQHRLYVDLCQEVASILGDQKRLVQVLTNLLNNSVKYTTAGGNITLKLDIDDQHVSISVVDNGIGIGAELLPRVFDLFTQAERAADRSQGGLGVGLALVKSLVELHGGKVTAASDGANQGSKFTVSLPRLYAEPQQHSNHQDTASTVPTTEALRLMIVDDNTDAARMLAMYLQAAGHDVFIEHSASAAIERARSDAPNVFLLDIGLPEMDGNELARHLRSQPETAKSVLIAITGYGQEQDRQKSKEAGFDYHLVKPVDTDNLMAVLADITQR
jgi:PAS domain S-box-containing protein